MTVVVTNKKGFPSGGSCHRGRIAMTDEGFVNLFKDKYNNASRLPLIRQNQRFCHLPTPTPKTTSVFGDPGLGGRLL